MDNRSLSLSIYTYIIYTCIFGALRGTGDNISVSEDIARERLQSTNNATIGRRVSRMLRLHDC